MNQASLDLFYVHEIIFTYNFILYHISKFLLYERTEYSR